MRLKTKIRLFFRRWRKRITGNRVVVFLLKPRGPWKWVLTWWRKRRINRAIRVLDQLDYHLKLAGYGRREIRQFWRDYSKKREFRTEVLNRITQQ